MRVFQKIEDLSLLLGDAEERAIPIEVEQKIIEEMYKLSIQRARAEFEAHEQAKKALLF